MQQDKHQMGKLLNFHKWLSVSKFLTAIPKFIFFLCLRIILSPISLLSFGILHIYEKWKRLSILTPLAFLFTTIDMFLSEPLTKSFYDILTLRKNYQTRRLKHILLKGKPYIFFLRDFAPTDSNIFEYKPLFGTTANYSHRDEYLFAGITPSDLNYPIIAIANAKDALPSNKDVIYLRLRNKDWQQAVKSLMYASHYIIIAVPVSGHIGRLFQMRNIQDGTKALKEYYNMHSAGFEKSQGLAIEIGEVLKDGTLYNKTMLVNAFMDGNPYVTSEWFHIQSFQKVHHKDITKIINGHHLRI
jgi:hypothetical protein